MKEVNPSTDSVLNALNWGGPERNDTGKMFRRNTGSLLRGHRLGGSLAGACADVSQNVPKSLGFCRLLHLDLRLDGQWTKSAMARLCPTFPILSIPIVVHDARVCDSREPAQAADVPGEHTAELPPPVSVLLRTVPFQNGGPSHGHNWGTVLITVE